MKYAISAAQSRAARALLNWSRERLASAGGVPSRTVADFELENTSPRISTSAAIRTALEAAGVEFIAENGGGPGVRLRKPGAQPSAADQQHPELRSVGPEDEDRAGPEAPDGDEVLEPFR